MSKEVEKNDAGLADVGWKRMEALLDEEMPTKKRFLLWWALSGAAVVGLVASVLLAQQDSNLGVVGQRDLSQSEIVVEHSAEDIAMSEKEDHLGTMHPENEGGITQAEISSSAAQITENSPAKVAGSTSHDAGLQGVAPTISTKAAVTQEKQVPKNFIEGEVQPIDRNLEITSDLEKDVVMHPDSESTRVDTRQEGEIQDGSEIVSDEGDRSPRHSDQRQPLSMLFSEMQELYEAPAPLNTPLADYQMIHPIRAQSEKRWLASVEFGGLMDGTGEKFSWDVGATLGFQIGNNLSFSSGAFIWSIADNEDFSFVEGTDGFGLNASNDALEPEMIPFFFDTVTFVSNGQSSWGRTRRLTYLRIPLYVNLFPSGKWSPFAGISYIGLLGNTYSNSEDATINNRDFQRNEISDLVRTSNVTLDLGIRFRPTKHLNIGLSYMHGTNSYLNYDLSGGSVPAIHRTWRLSLGYGF